jgi:hypothetical protein
MKGGMAGAIELIVLSLWLGAALIVAASVAPSAFAVLPSRTLAGALVGRVLPAVFISGILAALVAVICEVLTARGSWALRSGIPLLVLAAGCASAQFVVTPKIDRVRSSIDGPVENLGAADPRRVAFGKLHALSVAFLGLAMIGAAVNIGTRLYTIHTYERLDSH